MPYLTVKIQVNSKVEAYQIVSRLGFKHKVVEADFNGKKEIFDKQNQPNLFLKNNKKINKNIFRKLIK